MLFVRELSLEEEEELTHRLQRATRTKVYIRLKTVELSHQGKSVQEISTLLGRHSNSIRWYIHRFNIGGFSFLMPFWGGGASQKLKSLDKADFEDFLCRPPSHFARLESQAQQWTYQLLQQYLLLYEGVDVCQSTIWYHLRRVKYTCGRAKLSVTSPDPDYMVKRERVEDLEKKSSKGTLLKRIVVSTLSLRK